MRLVALWIACFFALAVPAAAAPDPGRWERVGFLERPAEIEGGSSFVPEIVDTSPDGNTLVTTFGEAGFAWIDITDPTKPKLTERETPGGYITSVNVTPDAKYLLVTAKRAGSTGSFLAVYDMATHARIRAFTLPEGPDGVAISPDGHYAVVAIENESDRATPGSLVIFTLSGAPATWTQENVPVVLDATFATNTDPQPEFVDIAADNTAIVSLQENNGYAVLDIPHARITRTFGAGDTDQLTLGSGTDTAFDVPFSAPREPDEVAWTRDGRHFLAANEGEGGDGGRSVTVYDRDGNVTWDSGNGFDKGLAERGQYPSFRSKGSEPEGVDIATIDGVDWAIVGSERGFAVQFYDITDPAAPVLRQSVTSGGPEPEGVILVPQRRLAISPDANAGPGGWSIYQLRPRDSAPGPHRQVRVPGAYFHGTQALGTGPDGSFTIATADETVRLASVDPTAGADLGEARGTTMRSVTLNGDPVFADGFSLDATYDALTGGSWVVKGGQPSQLWRVSRSGAAKPVALPDPAGPWAIYAGVVASPDGRTVYVSAWDQDRDTTRPTGTGRIYALDVTSGAVRTLTRDVGEDMPADVALTPDGDLLFLDIAAGNVGRLRLAKVAGVPDGTKVATIDAGQLARLAGDGVDPRLSVDGVGRVWTLNRWGELSDSGRRFPRTQVEPGAATGLPAPAPIHELDGLVPVFRPDVGVRDGDRLYVTGLDAFGGRAVWARASRGAALFTTGTGVPVGQAPAVEGTVSEAVPDGSGGFFLGGENLAHLRADGTVDPAFAPALDGPVTALAVDGGRVFVAGAFGLTALDASTGAPVAAWAGAAQPDGPVTALVAGGGFVYAAGSFATLGAGAHAGVGRVSAASGEVDAGWTPQLTGSAAAGDVLALGSDGLYLGGRFTAVSGTARQGLALLHTDGSVDTAFVPAFRGNNPTRIGGIALGGGRLYVASQNVLLGQPDNSMRLGAVDAATGALDTGFAAPTGFVSAPSPGGTPMAYSDGQIYARTTGGDLEVSRFDGATGAFDSRWRPAVQGFYGEGADVTALAVGDGAAFVGGVFEIAGVERAIGAIDLTTGKLDPDFNAGAARGTKLAAAAGWLYYLDETAGRLRRVDGRTGAPDGSYSLQVVGGVSGLTAVGDRIYVAGTLSFIGGEPADGVAALDAATGAVDPAFKPTISGGVSAVVARGDSVWLAGAFTRVGGVDRPGLAQVSAATGAVRAAFNAPSAGAGVSSLVLAGNRLYAGGDFTTVAGTPHAVVAAFDATTGSLDPRFAPKLRTGYGLLVHGGRLIVAGATVEGDATVDGLAALDLVTGAVDPAFLPDLPQFAEPTALASYGTKLLTVGASGAFEIGSLAVLTFDVAAPANISAPKITGTAVAGQTVTCEPGVWRNSPTAFAVRWLRDGVAAGAGEQRTLTAGDATHTLVCEVVASNAAGASTAVVSAGVGVAAAPADVADDDPLPQHEPVPAATPTPMPAPLVVLDGGRGKPAPRGVTSIRSARRKGAQLTVALRCAAGGCAGRLTVSWRVHGRTTRIAANVKSAQVTLRLSRAQSRALTGVKKVTVTVGRVHRTVAVGR
ncbi:hypothetical protein OM076_19060 [Solirubrobacter ginsenosidimutans]|uniref:Ig-like domain-containing protein n=1 Tax=Solirubrobacter ginsenosidimutans TaxID=490573 RepID=A0A9X3MW89_9ACTN|nr:hypothetical protein [Solirubrobacter ginsenosidimutans]MDA0162380.1 hypothetical protein [Solirubrobacter ginsenosidimutans]